MAIVALIVLSLSTFPVLSNDSLTYLDHSRSLDTEGFVMNGHRQFGYPLFLATVRWVGGLLHVEPLLLTVVLQRGLLLACMVLAWLRWRWWSVPLIAVLVVPETMIYANLALAEGLALSLAILIVFPACRCLESFQSGESALDRRRAITAFAVVVGLAIVLAGLRFSYLVFGVVPLILGLAGWRTDMRGRIAAVLIGFLALLALFLVATSVENRREFGQFTPIVDTASAGFYYAWFLTFLVHTENAANPELAEVYHQGRFRDFLDRVEAEYPSLEGRRAYLRDMTAVMLQESGQSDWGSRLISIGWGLIGGRVDDIGRAIDQVIVAQAQDLEQASYFNEFYREHGADALESRYNDGRPAGAIATHRFGMALPTPSSHWVLRVVMPLAIAMMVWGLSKPETRYLGVMGLIVVVAQATGYGVMRADNLRFLLPGLAFGIAVASAVASDMAGLRRPQPT
jgi:hypothetical protein